MAVRSRLPLLAALSAGALAVLLLGGVVLMLAAQPSGPVQTGMVRSTGVADIGGPFTLVDQDGETFTEAGLTGEPSLIYFGYTFCPDVCPLSLQVMKAAIERLPEDERDSVRPVFITVDPERDTVDHMKEYAGTPGFPAGLVALTGSEEQVEDAKLAYRVYSAKGESAGDFYLVDHTSLIYLMDSDGQFVAAFSHTESPETIAQSLEALVG